MNFIDRLKRLLGAMEGPEAQGNGGGGPTVELRPISCMEAMEKLQEYLDRELEGVSHAEVAHHFSICKKCFPHLKLEERFRDLLHRSQEDEVCPERVREQVLELLSAEAGESG
jgi:anti-sigma factor (TIGR02949 family)